MTIHQASDCSRKGNKQARAEQGQAQEKLAEQNYDQGRSSSA